MRRYAAPLAGAIVVVGIAPSCVVEDLDLSGRACPCGPGWTCVCDVCVPEDEADTATCGQGGGGVAPWHETSFAKRRRIDLGPVDETLTGFVVQVRLDAERIDYAAVGDVGAGLRFVGDDGAVLPHEIDHWDPAGTSVLWVALGEVAAEGGRFFVYYDDPEATDGQDPAAVWADYRAVWHMRDDLLDATANANHGTNGGSVDAEGRLGRARDFDGVGAYVDVGSDASLDDVFQTGATITAVIRANSFGGTDFGRIVDKSQGTAGQGGWGFELDNAAGNADRTLRFERGFDADVSAWFGPQDAIVVGQWHTVGIVYDEASGDAPRFFVDGAPLPASDDGLGSGAPTSDAAQPMRLGNHAVLDTRGFDGLIDEVRIAPIPRSNAFMAAQHRSITDDLVTFGPEETRP